MSFETTVLLFCTAMLCYCGWRVFTAWREWQRAVKILRNTPRRARSRQ